MNDTMSYFLWRSLRYFCSCSDPHGCRTSRDTWTEGANNNPRREREAFDIHVIWIQLPAH